MAQTRGRQHHPMRVESRACDRTCLGGDERWGIRVEGIDRGAVDVEDG